MTSEIDIFDLIIIGGGLAGNSLALALEAHSLKIALIEAINPEQLAHSPAGDRALALSAGSIAILDTLGAWQAVKSNATAIKEIHVSDRGHFGKTRLSARKEGVDALGYVISARDIESQLARLVAGASIHRLCPARLAGLSFGQDHVNVKVNHNGESLLLKARLLAGADGGNSSVRTLLGIAQQTTEYNQTALVTTVKTALPNHNVAYERFTESGPLALLPAGKNLCSVVWTRTHEDAEA
jgi:2-octaprenyl-6-methoxyphenol hydroxylase